MPGQVGDQVRVCDGSFRNLERSMGWKNLPASFACSIHSLLDYTFSPIIPQRCESEPARINFPGNLSEA
jgi:hypothetical protein